MKFPVQCPHCREQVDMTFDLIGTDGNCQACGVDFVPVDAAWGAEGRYLLKRYLGAGGMGIVFAARDTALGRDVALKIPYIDFREARRHKIIERFKTEVRAIERLSHPHICSIFESAGGMDTSTTPCGSWKAEHSPSGFRAPRRSIPTRPHFGS